ncbi:MAG: 3-oxocholest-4-en-26-oyl-CoA dehydrogenase beta subunit [Actinomycetota bacterium]|nr:3-oxocholest-4-en-26-oyl-CoA dehydrogenase beta subunit [Actinomycetota bacterium]
MDFSLSETQQELTALTGQILGDRMTLQHLKSVERSDDGFDRATWAELAKANLLGIAIPEARGGLGFGFLDLCLMLQEVGRHVAPLPLIPCLVSAALPIVQFGSDEQQALLDGVVAGSTILTAALTELHSPSEAPTTTAKADGDGWRIDGVKTCVPYLHVASHVLVPAAVDGGVAVFLVPTDAAGIASQRQETENHEPQFHVELEGVRVGASALIGDVERGREILEWTIARTTVALCAIVSGVADRATRLTAQYSCDRKQFDRQIATFQAVGQRMAECFIDNQGIELTMLQAATHLDEGRVVPLEVGTAKFWAAEGGSRIGHAALHVHGGISIDIDYPIHRYFLWIKQIEFTLGSATPQLLRIGRELADTPA